MHSIIRTKLWKFNFAQIVTIDIKMFQNPVLIVPLIVPVDHMTYVQNRPHNVINYHKLSFT